MSSPQSLARLRVGFLRYFRRVAVARVLSVLLLLGTLPLHLGCNYYYTRSQPLDQPTLTALASNKVFVVHQGYQSWELVGPRLNGEALEGLQSPPAPQVKNYTDPPAAGASARYKTLDKKVALNIVHLYISEYQLGASQQIRIPLSAIQRLDLVEKNTGKTTATYLLSGAGIAARVFVMVGIIALLLKSSCPFVYAHDGQDYRFVGEAYGGAIFAPLERDDYLPLPQLQPSGGGEYRLKLTNELKERQYTDLAELWVVDHAPGTQVLLDQRGGVHTLGRPQAPARARTAGGADCADQLQAPDHRIFLFNEELPGAAANSVTLTFAKPAPAAAPARLVLRAQNSLWLDYLYGEFARKFGTAYPRWAAHEKQVPAAKLNQWLQEQSMPLSVYLETAHGWQLVEHIPLVGPLAARDLVVNLAVCVTREFTTARNLLRYAALARQLGAAFIQLLEPRAVGHYASQEVALSEPQLALLEAFYERLNFHPDYHDWPIITYYGYHQRRLGCSGAADRFLYVDTDGDLHACPFCQKKSGSALTDSLNDALAAVRTNGCQLFHPSAI